MESEWIAFVVIYLLGCIVVYVSGWFEKRYDSKNRSVLILMAGAGLMLVAVGFLFQDVASKGARLLLTCIVALPMIVFIRLTAEKWTKMKES